MNGFDFIANYIAERVEKTDSAGLKVAENIRQEKAKERISKASGEPDPIDEDDLEEILEMIEEAKEKEKEGLP